MIKRPSSALVKMLKSVVCRRITQVIKEPFEGNMTGLLALLEADFEKPVGWPVNVQTLGMHVRRDAKLLQNLGWQVQSRIGSSYLCAIAPPTTTDASEDVTPSSTEVSSASPSTPTEPSEAAGKEPTPEDYGYPPALCKACYDNWDYALKLTTGELIYFCEATQIDREWVHLSDIDGFCRQVKKIEEPSLIRGVDVRVSEIVWVAAHQWVLRQTNRAWGMEAPFTLGISNDFRYG